MERLNFKLEFADNGVIVTDGSSACVNVYQEKEDGIRDKASQVTGVQTCALPICRTEESDL